MQQFDTVVKNRVMREDTAARMREALSLVVTDYGTARRAKVAGYKVAGKTGTAKKFNPAGGYHDSKYVCSFAGMLPAEDPEFVCVVVIDDPSIEGDPETERIERPGGGSVAAPVFARIAERAAAYMNIPQTEPVEEEEALADSGTE